eukprot:7763490-Pyramimonas_sp.AAC.1
MLASTLRLVPIPGICPLVPCDWFQTCRVCSRRRYDAAFGQLFSLVSCATMEIVIGFAPFVDNAAHVGGTVMGLLVGFALFLKPRVRQVSLPTIVLEEYI